MTAACAVYVYRLRQPRLSKSFQIDAATYDPAVGRQSLNTIAWIDGITRSSSRRYDLITYTAVIVLDDLV